MTNPTPTIARAHLVVATAILVFSAASCGGDASDVQPTVCQGNCDCEPPRTVCLENRCVSGCPSTGCAEGLVFDGSTGIEVDGERRPAVDLPVVGPYSRPAGPSQHLSVADGCSPHRFR